MKKNILFFVAVMILCCSLSGMEMGELTDSCDQSMLYLYDPVIIKKIHNKSEEPVTVMLPVFFDYSSAPLYHFTPMLPGNCISLQEGIELTDLPLPASLYFSSVVGDLELGLTSNRWVRINNLLREDDSVDYCLPTSESKWKDRYTLVINGPTPRDVKFVLRSRG
jgi:hypothetical protein